MRCKACNSILNDYESKRKDNDGIYVDLCGGCYRVSSRVVAEAVSDVDVDAIMSSDDHGNNENILDLL